MQLKQSNADRFASVHVNRISHPAQMEDAPAQQGLFYD